MSRQWLHWDSPEHARKHSEKLRKKVEKVQILKALLQMWEEYEHTDADHQYVLELRRKLRSAQNQLEAMQP